jgi:hypothetical protein
MSGPNATSSSLEIFWPAARARAVTRGTLWAAASLLLAIASFTIYRSLQFGSSVAGGRLVAIAIGVGALPLLILTVITAVQAIRWLGLAVWPGRAGVFATAASLTLRFGPFGTQRFEAAALDVKYPFELSGDFEDGGFEAFLPEEHQLASFLPRIAHPDAREPINRTILRYAAGTEAQIAAGLRPAIQRWREDLADRWPDTS